MHGFAVRQGDFETNLRTTKHRLWQGPTACMPVRTRHIVGHWGASPAPKAVKLPNCLTAAIWRTTAATGWTKPAAGFSTFAGLPATDGANLRGLFAPGSLSATGTDARYLTTRRRDVNDHRWRRTGTVWAKPGWQTAACREQHSEPISHATATVTLTAFQGMSVGRQFPYWSWQLR